RKFASLDHISGGRAGWNLITSQNEEEAYNFGLKAHPDHTERYERAAEFVKVVKGLWDSWEDDAFPRNKTEGLFFHEDKVHALNHQGKFFSVKGPLNVPRTPQGHPVIVQAGSSGPGMELAAGSGEVIFTAQQTLAEAQDFYARIKAGTTRYGRNPSDLLVMPGLFVMVGETGSEARERFEELQELIDPVVGLSLLAGQVGNVDLSAFPLDGPLPDLPETNAGKSRQSLLLNMARRENLTIRQLYLKVAGSRGHWQVTGSPQQVADQMEEWFISGAADGFCIMPPLLPGSLQDFVRLVIPELQRRGLFRCEYTAQTLRGHLGLRRPHHQFSNTPI
ncbi:MAG TPA: LLM class flavin-dependent oxidoreductase, partial [Flavisolibacter sp.]